MSSQKYTLFIDESGDAGIGQVRTSSLRGASPYMTMGGVLVPDCKASEIKDSLSLFRSQITRRAELHCNNLRHEQKVRFAEFLAGQKVLCFGVISRKETLGSYKNDIEGDNKLYYNKCAQYLLERMGIFLSSQNIPKENIKIIFEEGNFDYEKLKGLLAKCQQNPITPNTHHLQNIDVSCIDKKEKHEDPLLQLSDLVAHSLYRAVDGGEYEVCEYRYLSCLKDRFFRNRNQKILGNGIYAVHSIEDLKLPTGIQNFLLSF